ncbi:hypothetical protein MIB92_17415 [Aestuariirhabdus sp. Z084]|uniref:hypothetical protein n=1 Tax=Aestuariirhabdus haliotis TaxID=2918751 RepID=UPI00201B3FBD|nr:hypothetical protein [Aestuariirhabdus haliotis]MCL6417443.1 hypothetical protein [Aestuariirhabdus haliotis]MCL6421387.1 hypothetical protein [Aestuariirhabdus haliotis]
MHTFEPYQARRTELLTRIEHSGWRLKVYGVTTQTSGIDEALIQAGIDLILPAMPQPSINQQRYGVGFLIIHQGSQRHWFLADWWESNDILHHLLFSSPLDAPLAISPETDTSLIACVHELKIINFESQAWIDSILSPSQKPDFDAYLQRALPATL